MRSDDFENLDEYTVHPEAIEESGAEEFDFDSFWNIAPFDRL